MRLVWHGPGRWEPLTPVAAAATCFVLQGNIDTFAGSLADFVAENARVDTFEPGEEVVVDCYDWRDVPFVLRDGAFVEEKEPAHA